MKIAEQEVISERTEKSSRFLVTTSSIVILVKLFQVPIEDLSMLGVKAPANLFDLAASLILVYSFTTHLWSWSFDLHTWRNWYSSNYTGVYEGESGIPIGDMLAYQLSSLRSKMEGKEVNLEKVEKSISALIQSLESYQERAKSIWAFGSLYVYLMHIILPATAAICALAYIGYGDILPTCVVKF